MKLLVFLLLVSVQSMAQDQKLLIQSHAVKLKNAKEYTLKVAELMPESMYDFKPVADEMSFKEQIIHIGKNLYWLSSTFITEAPYLNANQLVIAKDMTKVQAIDFVSGAYEFAGQAIMNVRLESLSKEFPFSGRKLNKVQFLNLIQDHQTHHRAQLIVYLRLNMLNPPNYTGW
ncbi:MAG: hypothetical protein B7X86_02080 [Sphingobacteriales bacterium 17-39-43]|uniref:DinB family protein n=1 Tax=Daejeonella sp. TaxID=2805397 RepID=UPI000BC90DD1|nr:DinB family protein [Daejeonella sp.]OYZ33133.1 MAG: hypothetical protein B7Y24_02080 [Sphingobacteriales bacterium 16-39-50]OYZ45504.1 MAG: hypothetical protein B7Y19_08755 [Sphingobacteriales bacterium 24-40-4]OZA26542.1 MAG: hypothetical protein B7X86_02080 [Sphingobacteriales bacterium 17-39-43]HQS06979.1 DinB family protein [Daejeonella sp.]HQT21695.1 DinB family protein [Daejeonella sp.]